MSDSAIGPSPYDTAASSSSRFLIELVAWVAGPWAVASTTGQAWTALPTAAILIGLAAVFSTPGDKNNVVVPTPGPIRLVIEALTLVVAVWGAWLVWPQWAAILITGLAVLNVVSGWPRTRWLTRGAPIDEPKGS